MEATRESGGESEGERGGLRARWIFTEVGGKVGWLVGSLEFE